jgi:hypothetical protein
MAFRKRSVTRLALGSTKRRLKQLWRRRRAMDARINEVIRHRLRQLRRGSISSEDFEKATREERTLERLGKLIVRVEEKTRPRSRYTK